MINILYIKKVMCLKNMINIIQIINIMMKSNLFIYMEWELKNILKNILCDKNE